ncbi:MAG: hypothetical protein ABI641_04580 [Caldimonas sp.]
MSRNDPSSGSAAGAAGNPEVTAAAEEDGQAISLRVSVWPRTDRRDWHAELRMTGATRPLRFERPVDLVLFLTALPGSPPAGASGLR